MSRRETPWENKQERTPLQDFLHDTYKEHYYQKHDSEKLSFEIDLVNSLTVSSCPYCESNTFIKKGINGSGYKRYQCQDCRRSFTALTKTIFDGHKLSIAE